MKGYSFNRYIVECKSGFQEIDEDLGGVLIDTQWNVNNNFRNIEMYPNGFNRYIVECKS